MSQTYSLNNFFVMGFNASLVLAIIFVAFVSVGYGYQPPKQTTVPCDKDLECDKLPFTFCAGNTAYTSGLCSCTKDYVLRVEGSNFDCLEEAKLFNDPCVIDDQCKPKFGVDAACINKKCRCRPGAHFINLKCWNSRKLGETCGNPNNCIATDHSECSSTCKCVAGFIGNLANTKCLKIAQKIGDACEESVQCTSVNPQLSCQYKVCFCPPGYNAQGNSCVKPPVPQPQPPSPPQVPQNKHVHIHHNSASSIKLSFAIIAIPLFLFVSKFQVK